MVGNPKQFSALHKRLINNRSPCSPVCPFTWLFTTKIKDQGTPRLASVSACGGLHVLNTRYVTRHLKTHGHRVNTAASPMDALASYQLYWREQLDFGTSRTAEYAGQYADCRSLGETGQSSCNLE
jgi:hypothetical protein